MPLELLLLRFSSGQYSTLGTLLELGSASGWAAPATTRRFLCFVLEDRYRASKVSQETRIPAGRYRLALRKFGGFHERYATRFRDIHVGMIELLDVPGFTDILAHCGVSDSDTAGCLLLGDRACQNVSRGGLLADSELAYRRVYPRIAGAIAQDAGAFLTIEDFG